MFESNSRYASLPIKSHASPQADGQSSPVRYVQRRFLPAGNAGTRLLEHLVVQGDRLDNLTAKYLGDPTQFWRVADANDILRPEELTAEIGRSIVITLTQ